MIAQAIHPLPREEIDMTTEKGQEIIQKYAILASPGIIISGELFSSGGVKKEKLVEKLKSAV